MNEIIDEVLSEFEELSKIPRPSKHEKGVAAYLMKRLGELGATTQSDPLGNVIAEVPSSVGCEKEPLIIFQAHMDMVCVADEKHQKYNPLHDGIKLVREGDYLSARGTSLGADDGIGIAIILYLMKTVALHGPWRIIFTVDEEAGMSGARGLDTQHLADAKYLINVDSENVSEVVIGSAGSERIELSRRVEWTAPTKSRGVKIKIQGLKGGHSGEVIHIRHANALKVMAHVLDKFNCEVGSISGGRAMNVIPSTAEAWIAIAEDVAGVCRAVETAIRERFDEPGVSIMTEDITLPRRVISKADLNALLDVIGYLPNGPYDEETSANIGTLNVNDETILLEYMPRYHSDRGREVMEEAAIEAGRRSEFEVKLGDPSPAWLSEDNYLADMMVEVAKRQGRTLTKRVIHGGLECSHFIEKKPDLQIVSIGTTNLDIHTPKERLKISTIEMVVRLIEETVKAVREI